jgi:hypothetical protein
MVVDELWYGAGLDEEILCVGCFEDIIKRQLTPADFNDYPVNHDLKQKRSNRLNNRLGRVLDTPPPVV